MSTFYIKYTPPRRGLDMVEYLQDYLNDSNSGVTFSPCFYDNVATFGILSGEGDNLSKIIRVIEGRHSAVRLTADEFIGASVNAFSEYNGPETEFIPGYIEPENRPPSYDGPDTATIPSPGYIPPNQRPNWVNWLSGMGLSVVEEDKLIYAKYYKSNLWKEISKKKFYDDNDSIADLAKSVMAIAVHYHDLTTDQKTLVDNQLTILKQIYTVDVAIDGLTTLTANLQNILVGYYSAKVAVTNATTLEQINNIVYE